jgi:hypothetical protein
MNPRGRPTPILARINDRQARRIERVAGGCGPGAAGIDLSPPDHVSPLEWDHVLLDGRYVIDRRLIAWLDRFTSSLPATAVGVGRDAGAHPIEMDRIVPDPGPPRRANHGP